MNSAASDAGDGDYAFLFLDVDGYCAGGIDQRRVVSRAADGYRAREMGWAFYTADAHEAGSVYFCDATVPPLAEADPSVWHTRQLHGLPVRPLAGDYGGHPVLCSSRLLDAIRAVYLAVARGTGLPVVVVHKGGNEGHWAREALGDVPSLRALDLGLYGCPKVDVIGREAPHLHLGRACEFHAHTKRRARKVVHCPRLELELLADWVGRRFLPGPKGSGT